MYRGTGQMIQSSRAMGCVAGYRGVLKIPQNGLRAGTCSSSFQDSFQDSNKIQHISLHSSTEKFVALKVQQTILHCIACQGRTGVCRPTQSMAACTRIAPLACMYYYISYLDTSHQCRRQQHVSARSANADRLLWMAGNHKELYSWTG